MIDEMMSDSDTHKRKQKCQDHDFLSSFWPVRSFVISVVHTHQPAKTNWDDVWASPLSFVLFIVKILY